MREVAAMFGQTLAPKPRLIRQPVKKSTAHNSTTDMVFRAVPIDGKGEASAVEIAARTRLPILAVRQVLRALKAAGRVNHIKVGTQPATVYRYSRPRRTPHLETPWADVVRGYIHRMRGHWLRARDIRKGANLPPHVNIKRIVTALRESGVIDYHPLTAVEYQVRWRKANPQ